MGNDAQLYASGGLSYSWSPAYGLSNSNIDSPLASPPYTITYVVTATDSFGCTDKDSATVTLLNSQVIITASRDTFCYGDSVQLFSNSCGSLMDDFNPKIDMEQWSNITGAQAKTTCGSLSGKALYFNGNNTREAVTRVMYVATGGTINFYLLIGSGIAPCEDAEPGDNVALEYSTDGTIWNLIKTYDEALYPVFTFISENIPPAAQTANTQFRWIQPMHSGQDFDNWVLEDIEIICSGTGASSPTITWTPSTGLSDSSVFDPIAGPALTTTYTVTVNDSACISMDNFTVYVDSLNIIAGPDSTICFADTVQLAAAANIEGTSYLWVPSAGLSCTSCREPLASPASTTTYYVTGSNAGCSNIDSVTITVNPPPLADAGNDSSICFGDNLMLNASGGVSYSWTPISSLSDPSIANPSAFPSIRTVYRVTVISDSGCVKTDTVTISVNNLQVNASSLYDSVCTGGFTQITTSVCSRLTDDLDGEIDWSQWSNISGGSLGVSCGSISGDALYFAGSGSRKAVSNELNVASGGMISFNLIIGTGTFPCENADPGDDIVLEYSIDFGMSWNLINTYNEALYPSFTLINENIPVPAQTSNTLFRWRQLANSGANFDHWAMDDVEITCNGTTGPYTYSWSPAASLSDSTISNPIANPSFTTTYLVTVSDGSCNSTDAITITKVDSLFVFASPDAMVCEGNSIGLGVTSSIGGSTYLWSPSTGLSCTVCPAPLASPSSSITYYVTGLSGSCSAMDSLTLTVLPLPLIDLGNDTVICLGDSIILDAGAGMSGYLWSDSSTNQSFLVISGGIYFVQVTAINGCQESDTLTVTTIPDSLPVAVFSIDSISGKTVYFRDRSTNADSYMWNFGDGNTSTFPSPSHTYNNSGTYSVCLTVENSCGLSDSVCKEVTVMGIGINAGSPGLINLTLYPNPANDHVVLSISVLTTVQVEISVMNLIGKKLFQEVKILDPGDQTFSINIAKFSPGCYFLNVKDIKKPSISSGRFIKTDK